MRRTRTVRMTWRVRQTRRLTIFYLIQYSDDRTVLGEPGVSAELSRLFWQKHNEC